MIRRGETMNSPGKKAQKKVTPEKPQTIQPFPVVGIGASAGGLEALNDFFSTAPEKSGLAFIVLIHMSPNQPSMMAELLQKKTKIPVSQILDGQEILQDHIYIVPPGKDLSLFKGALQLLDNAGKNRYLPIDFFFNSLAQDQTDRAVGVILSGTGTDGTLGVKTIKANEGLVLVQSEETAKYDGMPRSAVKTGMVDIISSPAQMAEKIIQYFNYHISLTKEAPSLDPQNQNWLQKVYALLRSQVGHDFSTYKKSTILRRISRRMTLNQIESHEVYIRFMRENPEETQALFRELLIGVTSFFRDKESFEILKKAVLLKLLPRMKDETTFRVWIPGCSTGEEAYSIAMVLRECLDTIAIRINFQVFGTDIDKYAIDKAREGIFPSTISADVSEQRLKRFFTPEGDFYRIRKEVRDSVVFSVQDILKDPPFSRLNLLCCRNLLIYLEAEAQKKLLPLFHYTLVPDGTLVLGTSETIGGHTHLFKTLDNRWKIFKRKEAPLGIRNPVDFPTGGAGIPMGSGTRYGVPVTRKPDIGQLTQKLILEKFSPTAILIDKAGRMLHVQGRTGKFLEQISGQPSHNIVDMAREGLAIELSSAIRSAATSKEPVVRDEVSVKTDGDIEFINLHVIPLLEPQELSGYFLVVFEKIPDEKKINLTEDTPIRKTKTLQDKRLTDLELELQRTKETHQATLEELESSNEELKSTNEELQSSNEELQSTNEELESSKEELQSLNEELQTVNSELLCKVDELSSAEDDMRNLLNSTEIATVFVDNHLMVKRFTQESLKIINLIQTDIGRPINHVVNNLKHETLTHDLKEVLARLIPMDKEVQTTKGLWYKMRIMPYRTTDNRIDGAVLTFSNIDEQKRKKMERPDG